MRGGWSVTELVLGAIVFAILMALFYGVEHWAEVDIDEHEELTRKHEESAHHTENNRHA